MKKVWVLEERANEEWRGVFSHRNYYTFCGKVKKMLKEKDAEVIAALKKSIENEPYCEEIKEKFRATHNSVKNSYRVIEGEIPDEETDTSKYTFVSLKESVYSFLWGSK